MMLTATNDAFNINYFDFDLISSNEEIPYFEKVKVFPNPTDELLNISFSNNFESRFKIHLINASGKYRKNLFEGFVESGTHTIPLHIDPILPKGLYFIEIWNGNKRYFEKLIIN